MLTRWIAQEYKAMLSEYSEMVDTMEIQGPVAGTHAGVCMPTGVMIHVLTDPDPGPAR